MAEARAERRLAAILAADVAGYSRLMGADEEGTLAALKSHRREVIDPKITEHRGRIVKTTGDGALIEFASAVDAVRCAMEIQRAMAGRNAIIPENRRIEFRIGINIGDIIIDEGDIYGDGVNIAARVEALASPGAICISDNVHQQVKGKLALDAFDMGEQQLKNIAQPVRVHGVRLDGASARPALALPDKPSIAVLPFQNMSGDPEQEYFADGMVEDIITSLSRFQSFFVIARNSSFIYKGKAVDVRQVGRELGVRYVLEGSVRKGANRLRITAQLVDASTGNHLWAEKYDGAIEDVFDLQDKITEGVVGAIEPSVRQAEIERAKRKRPDSLDAYDLILRAQPLIWAYTANENAKATELCEEAVRIDPDYASAHGFAALCYIQRTHWSGIDTACVQTAISHANSILASNTDDAMAIAIAGAAIAFMARDYATGIDALDRAVTLNPNDVEALTFSALIYSILGNLAMATDRAQRSIRLNPFDPFRCLSLGAISRANLATGRFDDAVVWAQRSVQANQRYVAGFALLAAGQVRIGQTSEARQTAQRVLALDPKFRGTVWSSRHFADLAHQQLVVAALRESGLPD